MERNYKHEGLGNVRISERQRILVVDDVSSNFVLIKNMLPASYEIITVLSGVEALEHLDRSFFDLVLLDIEMPGMSGIELFQKMQESPEYSSIPVIFITAKMEARTVEKVINMGARDYLVKPFNQGDLQSKVARALKNTLEDQAELFLRRKIKVIQECCWNGNIGLAMLTMREIPKGVYSRSVLLRLSRGLTALHNRDVAHASEIVKEILNDIGK